MSEHKDFIPGVSDFFMVGAPGKDAWNAFGNAIKILETGTHGFYGRIDQMFGFRMWEGDPLDSYDEAAQMAMKVIEYGYLVPSTKTLSAICLKYKNASDVTEFLFFGWMYDFGS